MTIDAARDALATERRKVRAEREVFEEFERQVSELSVSQPAPRPDGDAPQLLRETGPDAGLGRLRAAYEATVMSVPHYEAEYGEPFAERVSAELAPKYADLLRTASSLTPPLKRGVVLAAADARQRRTAFLEILDDEEKCLAEATAFLSAVRPLPCGSPDVPFDHLHRLDEQLCEYENWTETRLSDRQTHLHRSSAGRTRTNRIDPKSLNQYLYRSLETTYPVLDALAQLLADIRTARRATARRIATYRG